MQNKKAIKSLAIMLALVSLYQLFFTYKTRQVENDARMFAAGDPVKEKSYLDSVQNEVVYNLLVATFTYKECKELELNLGLDLRGGMNVTMEVDVVDVVKSLANHSEDPSFNAALAEAVKERESSASDFVTLFGQAFARIAPGAQLASPAIFGTREMEEKIRRGASNEEVLGVIRGEANGAIDNTFKILSTRIDRFGVTQPNVRKADISGRIIIELPGVKDPQRVRELLQGTAALEFYETYDQQDFHPFLEAADAKLRDVLHAKEVLQGGEAVDSVPAAGSVTGTGEGTAETGSELMDALGQQADSLGGADPFASLTRTNPLFAVLSPNPPNNNVHGGSAAVGYALARDTSKVNAFLAMPQVRSLLPRNSRLLWGMKDTEGYAILYAIKITTRTGKAPLEGDAITDARTSYDSQSGRPTVSMTMNGEGARTWARLTKENVNHAIAIVLDGMVASAPNVMGEISGGNSQITGNFTQRETEDLSNILESGKLPAPAHIIADEVVGPSLGLEAIRAGMWSFVIAFAVVLLYMFFFYSKDAGLAANVALLANLFFLFGILASIGAVLTLPGIAGIVLTMGMAVDANVLIYERVQEEMRSGKGMKLAIKEGFQRSYPAIIDSNLTTLLTGVILYYFGEGPIKGFATTLVIGILTSLFTAIFISRLMLERIARGRESVSFNTSFTASFLRDTKFPFLKKRKISYTVSGILIAIGLVSLFTKGLDRGIDFVGGRTYTVSFAENVQVEDVAEALAVVYESAPEVKTFGTANQVNITTKYKYNQLSAEVDAEVDSLLYTGLKTFIPAGATYADFREVNLQRSQKIGAAVAESMASAAIWSVILALAGIFLYILGRFSRWQYGVGAVVGLAHNVLIVLGIYSVFSGMMPFSMEIDQSFIAAILTVVGYSLNDTVVVFDRIREYRRLYVKRDDESVVNGALNSTLRRTFNTSFSTVVVLVAIFIFGGASLKGFIFALLVGVIVGTYSSLFIATPTSYDLSANVPDLKKK
ncbi:MAG: protein translocase subunit SecDF [Odoribacteraceae bacterium]|jgi:SecD/SecF fusion protein|nr:protein translocase subunit SecDF [Odoribacteraceae bacterium]